MSVKVVLPVRLLSVLVAAFMAVSGPSGALADSPAGGSADLALVADGVPVEAVGTAWSTQGTATASLAPSVVSAGPMASLDLVPSDGKMHLVSANGHRLAIWCEGVGSPTILLEHGIGYGVDSDSWEDVQEGLARETRVCRYDRAFVGHSDDAKVGRSMPDLTSDLVALMTSALIPPPYILVGHSFGGLVVREFAKLHPKSVAGMVLVDGSARYAIVGLDLSSERLNAPKVLDQLEDLEEAGSLGHIPLVVITRGLGVSAAWKAAQAAEVKLSTSSRQVIATDSDHWIQLREPDLVVRQVLTVLHTIRRYQ
jgi:hypothetical protein